MVQMKRHTKSAKGKRRSHQALKTKTLNRCRQCGKAVEPHRACRFCGAYRSNQPVKTKTRKKTAK